MLNVWQVNLIFSLIAGIVFFQCYKLAIATAKHDGAATIILQVIAGSTMLAMLPFFELSLPSDPKPYALLLTACIFYAISDRIQTTVRKHVEVSTYSILGQLSNVFLILFGFLLFREPFILSKVAGAASIIGGNVLLQYRGKKIVLDRYIMLAILGGFTLAIALSIDIGNSKSMTLPIYIAITFFIPALIIIIGERISLTMLKQELQYLNIKYTLITGFFWSLLIFFLLRAYQSGSVSTIVPLQATLVLWNVLIATLLFKERSYLVQKVVAAVLVVIGIMLTVI